MCVTLKSDMDLKIRCRLEAGHQSESYKHIMWYLKRNHNIVCMYIRSFVLLREWISQSSVASKVRLSSLRHRWPLPILAILFRPLGFIALIHFNLFGFWACLLKVIQIRLLDTKFDIYVFIEAWDERYDEKFIPCQTYQR